MSTRQSILIVDDEPANISVLVALLSDSYELYISTNGDKALEILKTHRIDLILLDIVMPIMDGYEVAHRIKHDELTTDIPFIFLTAKNDSDSIVRAFKEGATDYLTKPFAQEELLIRVQNHLQRYRLKNELFSNKSFLESILENSTHAIITTDLSGVITLFNKAAEMMLGYTENELKNVKTPLLFHDIAQVGQRAKKLSLELDRSIPFGFEVFTVKSDLGLDNTNEWTYITKNGERLTVSLSVSIQKNINGIPVGYIGIAEDITEKKKQQKLIKDYMSIIDENVITSTTDINGSILSVSEAFANISGYDKESLVGKGHQVLKVDDNDPKIFEGLWKTITQDKVWRDEFRNKSKDGSIYWVNTKIYSRYDYYGKKVGYIGVSQDITDKKTIEMLSITDELTKLHNRRYFNEIFPQELNRLKRDHRPLAFLMIDVDHFKGYNDTYGHQKGDDVLVQIGLILNSFSKRSGDHSFRLGGEEFAMIFSEHTLDEAISYAQKVKEAIESLKIVHSKNTASRFMTISIGLVFKNYLDEMNIERIYKESDENLYKAKQRGRNMVVWD